MGLYILKRCLYGLVTVWFIATATFFAMHALPGDPLAEDKAVSPEIRRNLEQYYGLDKPLYQQYARYLSNMARGDLGVSFTQKNRSVNDIVAEHFPVSAALGCLSLLFAALGGVLWGGLAARFRNRWPDNLIMLCVILFISVPGFVLAALAQLSIVEINRWLGWTLLPVAGWGSLAHMWVPSIVLGLATMAYLARLTRASLLENSQQEYLRMARAKGLSRRRIFWHHELRNALLPVVTVLGPAVAAVTTGGFVVELIFAIPGLGRYFVQAVQQLDYTVIMGTTVFYGAFLVLMVLLADIVYGLVDPRVSLAEADHV
ncbi:MAG: ABC transporter permease [Pseudomonadales bacterium]